MSPAQGRVHRTPSRGIGRLAVLALAGCAPATAGGPGDGTNAPPSSAHAPSSIVDVSLVFDGVTVVDVEQGKLVPAQRMVITGNRITAVGAMKAVKTPRGAQVVDARGKYLIPGLWDMHVHPQHAAPLVFYPLFLANGVTGIRDAGSEVPLDTLRRWRQEILAGRRVGPPRQLFSGKSIDGPPGPFGHCGGFRFHVCATDSAAARRLVDSLRTAGADMLKTYSLSREMYFVIAAEARRLGMPFGGHPIAPGDSAGLPAAEMSDSGARLIDHAHLGDIGMRCVVPDRASVARCQPVAERFRRHGTWLVPTLVVGYGGGGRRSTPIVRRLAEQGRAFWPDSFAPGTTIKSITELMTDLDSAALGTDSAGFLPVAGQVGLPILAGTDAGGGFGGLVMQSPGFSLHAELALYVAQGLSPVKALQTATLNPAKFLRGTDTLGTVAPGKLADLVLLDADPLVDIANTMKIRAVVANGRYFDRAALDRLLAEVRAKANVAKAP